MHYRAPRDVSVLYALRRGEVVHLYLDQHAAEGGVVVEFFGQPMPAFAGPAVLARLLRCPVLPIFIVPEGRNRWTAEIGPAFDLQWSDDKDADILRATQAFVRAIERVVRRYPEQWMWMNSCWLRPDDRPRLCLPELLERIPPAVRQSLSVDVNTQHRARPPAHD
jgi:lauroyl/myristoyl acyltransferase